MGTLTPADFALLSAAVIRVKFQSLRDNYSSPKDGCTETWTDHPSILITVEAKTWTKSVDYYEGCRGPSGLRRIAWLADTIDEITSSTQWIEGR